MWYQLTTYLIVRDDMLDWSSSFEETKMDNVGNNMLVLQRSIAQLPAIPYIT